MNERWPPSTPVADDAAFSQNDPSAIRRWIRQRERTGAWCTRPRSGRPRKLASGQEPQLIAQVAAHPDATLAEHGAHWQAATGMRISVSTVGRWLRRLAITRNKRR